MNEPQMTKESIEEVFKQMTDMLVKKNADYGNASFDLGIEGNMVHIWDKCRRYRTLIETGWDEHPNFEGLSDTLRDLIGYSVIGLHILKAEENAKKNNTSR
jgi:hypothetical protein